jgi:crossover junction endodeoxyribonuclease RuvC
MMRILGIDPGLRCTGWGVIAVDGGRLQHIANGAIQPKPTLDDAARLQIIFDGLCEVINLHQPDQAAIEQIFVAKSAGSALRLGMARGVGILACGVNRLLLALALPIKNKSKIWSRACWQSRHKMPMLLMRWQLQSPPAMRLVQRRQSG